MRAIYMPVQPSSSSPLPHHPPALTFFTSSFCSNLQHNSRSSQQATNQLYPDKRAVIMVRYFILTTSQYPARPHAPFSLFIVPCLPFLFHAYRCATYLDAGLTPSLLYAAMTHTVYLADYRTLPTSLCLHLPLFHCPPRDAPSRRHPSLSSLTTMYLHGHFLFFPNPFLILSH